MKKNLTLRYLVVALLCGIFPVGASAATVYLDASRATVSVGDTVIITTKINAEGVTINTVEGDVVVSTGGERVGIKEFSLANSSFGLWPRTPSLSSDGQVISFVAGVPGGFNIEGATVFKTIFEAKKEGSVVLVPQNMIAYANDGKGTKLPVQTKSVVITVESRKEGVAINDEWNAAVSNDSTAPENFIIVLGQDASLFENKKFAFFSALDNQTGISYYEVSENGAPAVRSGSTYVLSDQDGNAKLTVTAYDKAGNKKVAVYSESSSGISWVAVVTLLIVLIILYCIYKKWRKSKKNASGAHTI